ncbi:MAG TPA: hypothetical protein PK127_04205 [Clostridiales bacterium]|nr:hypothetical protein [Clostridiales bacterium]
MNGTDGENTSVVTDGTGKAGERSDSGSEENGVMYIPEVMDLTDERERKYLGVEWRPISYVAGVIPYKVMPDLSNVVNAGQFEGFTDKQLRMLAENGFLVVPSTDNGISTLKNSAR